MFDTLTYANKLKEAGFTEKQAGAQAEALASVVDSNLATKLDIELVRRDLKELEISGKRDLKELEMRLESRLRELELKFEGRFLVINWMLGFVLAGILSLIIKAFFAH
jgi:hypothetical protein